MLNRGDSLSLTSGRGLYNYVEERGGRLIGPKFRDGLPCQLFDALKIPKS